MIEIGSMHGLLPQDIYNMEMWEFLAFMRGQKEKQYNEQMNVLTWSHRLAIWSRSFDTKPPKDVKKYMDVLDEIYDKKKAVKQEPVDVNKSRDIHDQIEKLKKESDANGME